MRVRDGEGDLGDVAAFGDSDEASDTHDFARRNDRYDRHVIVAIDTGEVVPLRGREIEVTTKASVAAGDG